MLRILHGLFYAVALVAPPALLALPAPAHADATHAHRDHRHYYLAADVYPYRDVDAILYEVARSPVYTQFGGYEDAYAASHYFGPNQRHYFGDGWDVRFGYWP